MLVTRPAATVSLLLLVSAMGALAQPAAPLAPRARVLVVAAPGAEAGAVDALYGGFSVLGVPPVDPDDRLGVDAPAPAGAFEAARPDEVRDALFAARAAFGEFDVERARERLSAAEAALLRLPSPEGHRDLFGEVLLLEAEVALAAGEREPALVALRKLARLSPDLTELHPGLYAPALVDAYQEARALNDAERSGTLVVLPRVAAVGEGDAPEAEVIVDGEAIGGTSRTLPAGPHLVTVRADGRLTRSTWVDLDPAVPLVLDPLLVPEGAGEARLAAKKAIVDGPPFEEREEHAEALLALTGATWLVVEGVSPPAVFAAGVGQVRLEDAPPGADAVARAQAIRAAIDRALLLQAANGQVTTTMANGNGAGGGSSGLVSGQVSPTGSDDEAEGSYATPLLAGTGVLGAAAVGTLLATATASAAWYYYAFFVPHVPPEAPAKAVLGTCCPL